MPDARRLFLHVGLQKTGTSYLQAALLRSHESLADQGLDLVPPTKRECFELMVVVRDRYEARRDPVSDRNILERFTAQLEAAPGSRAVFSQESLAAAGPPQIERLLAACGDREVHVVLTVRDLARQLPSSWQEDVKAGGTTALGPYLRRLRSLEQSGKARHPWIHLDPPLVLKRWADTLSPDRVHVVTVPPSGSPTTLLLERFARVLEVDPTRFEPEDRPSNSSLGMVQAEVLRRVNAELPEEVHRRYVYSDVVKRSFGTRVLGPQEGRKILVPGQFRPWCEEVAERQIADLERPGTASRARSRSCAAPTPPSPTTSGGPPSARSRRPRCPPWPRCWRPGAGPRPRGGAAGSAPHGTAWWTARGGGSGLGSRTSSAAAATTPDTRLVARGEDPGREEWTWRGEWSCTWAR